MSPRFYVKSAICLQFSELLVTKISCLGLSVHGSLLLVFKLRVILEKLEILKLWKLRQLLRTKKLRERGKNFGRLGPNGSKWDQMGQYNSEFLRGPRVTVWKFSVPKLPFFAISGVLNFVNLPDFALQKVQNCIKCQSSEPLNLLKWQILRLLNGQF